MERRANKERLQKRRGYFLVMTEEYSASSEAEDFTEYDSDMASIGSIEEVLAARADADLVSTPSSLKGKGRLQTVGSTSNASN